MPARGVARGALLYIGQTRDAALGGFDLFSMAVGMGVPLLLLKPTAGTLLTNAGPWVPERQPGSGSIAWRYIAEMTNNPAQSRCGTNRGMTGEST